MKSAVKFILKNSVIFALISLGFSAIGGMFPDSEHTFVIGNPLVVSTVNAEHILGHISVSYTHLTLPTILRV